MQATPTKTTLPSVKPCGLSGLRYLANGHPAPGTSRRHPVSHGVRQAKRRDTVELSEACRWKQAHEPPLVLTGPDRRATDPHAYDRRIGEALTGRPVVYLRPKAKQPTEQPRLRDPIDPLMVGVCTAMVAFAAGSFATILAIKLGAPGFAGL